MQRAEWAWRSRTSDANKDSGMQTRKRRNNPRLAIGPHYHCFHNSGSSRGDCSRAVSLSARPPPPARRNAAKLTPRNGDDIFLARSAFSFATMARYAMPRFSCRFQSSRRSPRRIARALYRYRTEMVIRDGRFGGNHGIAGNYLVIPTRRRSEVARRVYGKR